MRKIILGWAVLTCAMTGAALAAEVRQVSYGCKSLLAAEQLLNPRAADADGRDDRLRRLVRAGECRLWQVGEHVSAEAHDNGFTCLASKGARGTCYWSVSSLAD
jgi:hypothetical protein